MMIVSIFTLVVLVASPTLGLPDSFDYLVFAQQWPQTVCVDSIQTHEHKCWIGRNVTSWTVHGLWPNKYKQKGPNFCNDTYIFRPELIAGIEGLMLQYWPNLYTDSPLTNFWRHEWLKHGTCALSLPSLDNEYNYFSTGLKLNRHFNIAQLLAEKGIVPTPDRSYKYQDVLAAVQSAVGGHTVLVLCFHGREAQYLLQVEICVDKQFEPIDCEHAALNAEGCEPEKLVTYPPISHRGLSHSGTFINQPIIL